MNTLELIDGKVSEGKAILQRVEAIQGLSSSVMNVVRYAQDDVESIRNQIKKWQFSSMEVLIGSFGEPHRYVISYEDTIIKVYTGRNYKKEFKFEINEGLNILESISESLKLGLDKKNGNESENRIKPPMIFISHSSKDKYFVEALVDLLEDLGFNSSNLFCSSVDGYGIGLSKDICETLRSLFNEYNLFVIFIHSPRYYDSIVSLNEMGAAWVLKNEFCSFLTTDMEFDMMKGVVNGRSISIKVNNDDALSRLTELKDKLIQEFGLKDIDGFKWNRKQKMFLKIVCSIVYSSESN